MPYGTPQQVKSEVRRYCEILGSGGGYILAPGHLFQPGVPMENIIAFYEKRNRNPNIDRLYHYHICPHFTPVHDEIAPIMAEKGITVAYDGMEVIL